MPLVRCTRISRRVSTYEGFRRRVRTKHNPTRQKPFSGLITIAHAHCEIMGGPFRYLPIAKIARDAKRKMFDVSD